MIDIWAETIFFLTRPPHILTCDGQAPEIHKSTLRRWTVSGCRGVVLEHIQVGSRRASSKEALQRFFDRLTELGGSSETPSPSRTNVQRQRQSQIAAEQLEKLGVRSTGLAVEQPRPTAPSSHLARGRTR
jgi:hypothetical protein